MNCRWSNRSALRASNTVNPAEEDENDLPRNGKEESRAWAKLSEFVIGKLRE
jgi:hypothetical protein